MNELFQCSVCRSLVTRDQVDGACKTCGNRTCIHCKRVCDRCQEICCMMHLEAKIVMRQQQPYPHRLCLVCRGMW